MHQPPVLLPITNSLPHLAPRTSLWTTFPAFHSVVSSFPQVLLRPSPDSPRAHPSPLSGLQDLSSQHSGGGEPTDHFCYHCIILSQICLFLMCHRVLPVSDENPSVCAHLSHQPPWAQPPRFIYSRLCRCRSKCRCARTRVGTRTEVRTLRSADRPAGQLHQ